MNSEFEVEDCRTAAQIHAALDDLSADELLELALDCFNRLPKDLRRLFLKHASAGRHRREDAERNAKILHLHNAGLKPAAIVRSLKKFYPKLTDNAVDGVIRRRRPCPF